MRCRLTSRGDPFRSVIQAQAFAIGLSLAICCPSLVRAQVLTNAADVLSLSAEQAARKLPISVRGVVTAAEASWGGRFFLQDATSGIFVGNRSEAHPEPGDVVEVKGFSYPGAFAPTIIDPVWEKVGTAPLPEGRAVPIEQIMSGSEDGQRVEIVGSIRAVEVLKANLDVEIASGGFRLHVFPKPPENVDPQSLVGAKVRVKGTAAASFNAALRRLVSVVIFVPLPTDFIIEQTATANPFEEPTVPLNSIAQYRRDVPPGRRVHVKGVVTLKRPGEDLFLMDETGGLQVRSRQVQSFAVGDVIEAVGFPEFDHFLPVLDDAAFKKTSEPAARAKPKRVPVTEIQGGLHHADLVSLEARLLDVNFQQNRSRGTNAVRSKTVLMLQHQDLVFTAEALFPESRTRLATLPVGSLLEVSGVCFTESGEDKKLRSLQVLLPDAGSVRLLKKPSWLTPRRLLVGLGLLLVILVGAVGWVVTVSNRNRVLNGLIGEKEEAQKELQLAHDQLEERVKERTAQLKFQITARKESEVQYKAVLAERTRLAQEIHDTLEQTLTGIALQLDTTSKLFEAKPERANHHLELARDLVAQSQVDVRRSVWDLRSRALEQFDLPGAMVSSGKQLTDGTNIRFEVTARGRVRPLPEIIEENLLRIAQEALTNVIKHSQATAAEIELDYGPRSVLLQIKDNGRGIQPNGCAGPGEGHFGLLGISERAKRLGTEAIFQSAAGQGTTVRVQVAIDQEISSAPVEGG
jgi:signal transduction histidine kinase